MDSLYISGALLLLVAIDAVSDGWRALGRQILHHLGESIHLGAWFAIWALFEFLWIWPVVYVLARIWLFDTIYNVVTYNRLMYVGNNDLWGRFIRWVSGVTVFNVPYENTAFILRLMAFLSWLGLTLRTMG